MPGAARVGLFVLVFIAMLVGAYAALDRTLLAQPVERYYATFRDAGGVAPGTPVLMAGVRVGSVEQIELASPSLAKVTLGLDPKIKIPRGSSIVLPASLIGIGDNPLSIIAPDGATTFLEPGSTLTGRKGSPFVDAFPQAEELVAELNRTLVATRKLMEDEKLKTGVTDMLAQSTKTLEQFGNLAAKMDLVMAENQGSIRSALRDGAKAVADAQKVTAAVAKLVQEGKLQKDATELLAQVKETSKKADELVASMNRLLNDPELINPTKAAAANIAEMTATGKQIASNTEAITRNGATISEKAITLTDKANEIATKASELTDQLKSVLNRVDSFFNRGGNVGPVNKIETEIDLIRETEPGYWRTDVSFRYPTSDGAVHVGLWDTFESNKLTVQFERPMSKQMGYRYGVFASKPGVGVDYSLAPRLGLRGDLWDINEPRLDLRARYDLGNGLVGWMGVDRVFNKNAFTLGLGARR